MSTTTTIGRPQTIDRDKLASMWSDTTLDTATIADRLGCTASTVLKYRKKWGLAPRIPMGLCRSSGTPLVLAGTDPERLAAGHLPLPAGHKLSWDPVHASKVLARVLSDDDHHDDETTQH